MKEFEDMKPKELKKEIIKRKMKNSKVQTPNNTHSKKKIQKEFKKVYK